MHPPRFRTYRNRHILKKGNDVMVNESEATEEHTFRAKRTQDEVVLRFPSLDPRL